MADYTTLKAAIAAVIKTNGNQEITGLLLQQSLMSLIDEVNTSKEDNLSIPATSGFLFSSTNQGVRSWVAPYTHPTSPGSKHIPSGGAANNILIYSADGTAVWGANNYSLPTAEAAVLGGVKIGAGVTITDGVISVSTDYLAANGKAADSELLDNHDSTYFATATGGTGYIQNQIASAQTADYWISGKAKMGTLVLPASATLASGEVGLYTTESGFVGETPSGAGSVTSVGLSMPTGFSVANSPITESGTLAVTFTSGYRMFTETEIGNKIESSLIGAANGITPLDSGGKVALQYLPNTLLKYIGVWNASTNTPTLTNPDTTKKGFVYNVSVVGTQFGISWGLGDWLIYNDSGVAEKSDNSDDVTSVNGFTGAVTLTTANISEGTNLYYTDARVKAYGDTLYTPIAHGQITSGNPHGTTAAQVGALALTGGTLSGSLLFSGYQDIAWNGGWGNGGTTIVGYANGLLIYPKGNIGGGVVTIAGQGDVIHSGNSNSTSINWSAAKLTSTTLLLPQSAPSLSSGEMAIYGLESGFSGELPSGAGSVDSVALVSNLTGISVSGSPITTSGTFTLNFVSGYQLMTTTESTKLAGIAANANNYSLPTATGSILGGVKIGSNITITDGVISVATPYSLPTATDSVLGGVKIGSNITITEGVISVHNPITLGENQNGLSLNTQVLSLGLASATTNGALSSTDWSTFNGKEPAFSKNTAFNKDFGTTAGTVLEGRTFGTAAAAATTDFLAANGKAADSDLLDGHDASYFAKVAGDAGQPFSASSLTTTAVTINRDTAGLIFNRTAVTGYCGINYATNNVNKWWLGMRENLSSDNYIIYNESLANDAVTIALSNNAVTFASSIAATTASFTGLLKSEFTPASENGVAKLINNNNTTWSWGQVVTAPNIPTNGHIVNLIGYATNTNNAAYMGFTFVGNGSADNKMTFGFYAADHLLTIKPSGAATFVDSVAMRENINTNLRIPKVAPTSPTSGEYYFYIVE